MWAEKIQMLDGLVFTHLKVASRKVTVMAWVYWGLSRV
jgi:hypothetical protein